ncbi:MAG TPA: VapC toxin family PIN domain ribonuclease [Syntrophus sp. (in: bacteria)]|jgi:tRNA(fMet)-specific endonuclease VapC|nr:VapC toxin family PIN domain ribonuclease [Syntrophus sp. (in: bacteria)]
MGIIFDTSAIIGIERGRESLDALIAGREEESFGISVITAAELLHGVERADTEERKLRRQAFVEKVIESFPVFPFDLVIGRIYARIWAAARKGWTVGAHDLIIAATAISLDYTVATVNIRDFEKIPGVKIEKLQ